MVKCYYKEQVEVTLMVGCLILSYQLIEKSTIKLILNSLLQYKDYEVLKKSNKKSVVFLWHATKQDVWQSALDLEFAGIHVGYGFGRCKREAKDNASSILLKRHNFK